MPDKSIEELLSSYDIPKREVQGPIKPYPYKALKELGTHSINEDGTLVDEDGEETLKNEVKARKPDFENYTPPHNDPENYMTKAESASILIGIGLGATAGMISGVYSKAKENLGFSNAEDVAGSLKDRSFTKKAAGATLVGAGLAYGAKKGLDKTKDLVEVARSYF